MVYRYFITMNIFLPVVYLIYISQNVLGHSIEQKGINFDDGISYQDIVNVKSCFPLDSCIENRTDDPNVPVKNYMCSCNTGCWEIGTCCIDSPYRVKTPIQKCSNIGDSIGIFGSYMVYRCPDYTYNDSIWKNLCEKEWSGEDDILMLSPVTSLETSRTYKNYHCFKCHETTDKYISWNLGLQSTYNISKDKRDYNVTYNQAEKTWTATVDDNLIPIPVNLSFQYPFSTNSEFYPKQCDLSLISNCHDNWTDKSVRDKCLAYTAVVYQGFARYKNVHCALCNYVALDSITCRQTWFVFKEVWTISGGVDDNLIHMFNINGSVRDKAGDSEKCDKDHLWDPYVGICRKITCAISGYVIKDNRCVPP